MEIDGKSIEINENSMEKHEKSMEIDGKLVNFDGKTHLKGLVPAPRGPLDTFPSHCGATALQVAPSRRYEHGTGPTGTLWNLHLLADFH